jgi:hypothetical protein
MSKPQPVNPDDVPGTYYIVERFGQRGWKSVGDEAMNAYKTAAEARWARAKLHVEAPALPLSATRVVVWRWS